MLIYVLFAVEKQLRKEETKPSSQSRPSVHSSKGEKDPRDWGNPHHHGNRQQLPSKPYGRCAFSRP